MTKVNSPVNPNDIRFDLTNSAKNKNKLAEKLIPETTDQNNLTAAKSGFFDKLFGKKSSGTPSSDATSSGTPSSDATTDKKPWYKFWGGRKSKKNNKKKRGGSDKKRKSNKKRSNKKR